MGDITCIPTGEGRLYLAVVKDSCIEKIVGYTFSKRIGTQLTLTALDTAHHHRPAKSLICHSDRVVQYVAMDYREGL